MKITFYGAASEVTGSQHLIETRNARVLLDCGLFQGRRAESRKKNETFYCEPKRLDAVVLSHAHIDHCGNLPGLFRHGFRGSVFSTDATADIAELMLADSAHIQHEDAKYLSHKLKPGHPPVEPLYSDEDVAGVMRRFEPCSFREWREAAEGVRLRLHPAGHILGSAIVELEIEEDGERRRVVFTGDLGRRDMPLLVDPAPVEGADVLITESTYGGRVHPPAGDMKAALLSIIEEAFRSGGRVILPAFSLGRTQQVVYFLNELFNEGKLPEAPVFVDSPLATRLTRVFRRYDHTMDEDVQETLKRDTDVFAFPGLTYVGTREQSMALNHREGAFVVISASGMCESGRVVHHLKHAVERKENIIVLLGYQAPHTLGRHIADRRPEVRIFDRQCPLRAQVRKVEGLSAHAGMNDLQWWFQQSASSGRFGRAFLVHGEVESARALSGMLRAYCSGDIVIPQRKQSFDL